MDKIITMRKKGSPHTITFTPDEDPHFTNVRIIKTATREVKGTHYILTSDLTTWTGMYRTDGFRAVEETVQVAPQNTKINRSKSAKAKKNCTTVVQS